MNDHVPVSFFQFVSRLIRMVTNMAMKNPGISSYNAVLNTLLLFQIKTVTLPVINPPITPALVVFFQNRARSDVGPMEAPRPAHLAATEEILADTS